MLTASDSPSAAALVAPDPTPTSGWTGFRTEIWLAGREP